MFRLIVAVAALAPISCLPEPPPTLPSDDEEPEPEPIGDVEIDPAPFERPTLVQSPCLPTPVITLVDDVGPFETFDIVRLSGVGSDGAPFIGGFEWRLIQRPAGSQAALFPADSPNVEIETDLAGRYVVQLDVFESVATADGLFEVRSCVPAQLAFDVVVSAAFAVVLSWDHPDADFDLHLVRLGGELFSPDDAAYFSNRNPPTAPPWSTNAAENPSLAADDARGFGPEVITIDEPRAGDAWSIYVHYWNAQTDADPEAPATVRVYLEGELVSETEHVFPEDEALWHVVDVDGADVEIIDAIVSLPRPF